MSDKLRSATTRKLSSDTVTDIVAVLAIAVDIFLKLSFVRALYFARVDVTRLPAISIDAETLGKRAFVACRIAKREPDDFCVYVSQRFLRTQPDDLSDRSSFIEDQHDALAFIVQALESVWIILVPCDQVGAPRVAVLLA